MKVRDLIRLLEACNPDATVLLATQPRWPFESDIAGVCQRGVLRDDIEENPDREPPDGCSWDDVLLAEGRMVRYGDRTTWDAAER